MDKHCRLMRCYGWSEHKCWLGATSAEGWVRYNWALENELSLFGQLYERDGDGYVQQEAKRLLEAWRQKAKSKSA